MAEELVRRELIRRGVQVLSAFSLLPLAIASAKAAESCVDPASESLRESLHYAASAPNAAQSCSACGFFSPAEGKAACGNCMIMNGPVDLKGHCDSWSAKG